MGGGAWFSPKTIEIQKIKRPAGTRILSTFIKISRKNIFLFPPRRGCALRIDGGGGFDHKTRASFRNVFKTRICVRTPLKINYSHKCLVRILSFFPHCFSNRFKFQYKRAQCHALRFFFFFCWLRPSAFDVQIWKYFCKMYSKSIINPILFGIEVHSERRIERITK